MKGKKTEYAEWIKQYLKEQGADTSNWDEYKVLYNRYAVRIRKYNPKNYEQFKNLCTFQKLTKKSCGARDLGESKPKEPYFNEERWFKDELRGYNDYKVRMARYRDDLVRNQEKVNEEKDRIPYLFLLAIRCLSGRLPEECFPEVLSDYREELQRMLDEQRRSFKEL